MIALIHRSDQAGVVHQVATALAAGVPQRDFRGQLNAVHDFLRERVRLKRDTYGVEVVRDPTNLLREIAAGGTTAADCDDLAMLGAALVRAMGFRAVLIVVSAPGSARDEHVFYGAVMGGQVVPFDPQEGTPPGRWPRHGRRTIFPVG